MQIEYPELLQLGNITKRENTAWIIEKLTNLMKTIDITNLHISIMAGTPCLGFLNEKLGFTHPQSCMIGCVYGFVCAVNNWILTNNTINKACHTTHLLMEEPGQMIKVPNSIASMEKLIPFKSVCIDSKDLGMVERKRTWQSMSCQEKLDRKNWVTIKNMKKREKHIWKEGRQRRWSIQRNPIDTPMRSFHKYVGNINEYYKHSNTNENAPIAKTTRQYRRCQLLIRNTKDDHEIQNELKKHGLSIEKLSVGRWSMRDSTVSK